MKGTSRFVTILLAVLSVIGIVAAVLFLRNEMRLSQERQEVVGRLSAELEPINEERNEWIGKDEEWQKNLAEKQKGTTCILLCFDDLGENLYDTVFTSMDDYGFKGTFSLKNGVIPGLDEAEMDAEEFEEMLDSGWDLAVSFGKNAASDEDGEDGEETETTVETDDTGEAIVSEPVLRTGKEWLDQIDSFRQRLEENEMVVPEILFCSQEQYESVSEDQLTSLGFEMVRVENTEEFPAISVDEGKLLKIDSGLYSQRSDLGNQIEQAVQKGESLAIDVNRVIRITSDPDYELSASRFSALLSQLKSMEEQELLHVYTFTEYSEYMQKEKKEYKAMLAQYNTFREEMNARTDELDRMEQELVEEARTAVEDKKSE